MNRTPITSSNIRSAGFENGVMHIEFTNGKVYEYKGPKVQEHFDNLMKSDSKGRFFTQNIRHCKDTVCKPYVEDAKPAAQG